jgi:hypothetical protein
MYDLMMACVELHERASTSTCTDGTAYELILQALRYAVTKTVQVPFDDCGVGLPTCRVHCGRLVVMTASGHWCLVLLHEVGIELHVWIKLVRARRRQRRSVVVRRMMIMYG